MRPDVTHSHDRKRAAHRQRSLALLAGLGSWVLAAGAAFADDTEIFVNQGASAGVRPNVLFIVDTSGSMNGLVQLDRPPYDPAANYDGECGNDRVYFQRDTATGTPDCSDDDEAAFDADDNRCAAAVTALAGTSGRWTGRALQWVEDDARWRPLGSDDDGSFVECQADSGLHGQNESASARYARNGSESNPWTTNQARELDWGVATVYTLFSGNYLNWLNSPAQPTSVSRLDVVKAVGTSLAYSIDNVNLGLMRFSTLGVAGDPAEGGMVAHAIAPIADSRETITSRLDSFSAQGFTPLSETLYEAGQYLAGRNVEYGLDSRIEGGQSFPSVPESRVPSNQARYQSPVQFQCQRNYVVLLTDGEPTADNSADARITALPGFRDAVASDCDGTGPGRCLDDMAEYLYDADLNPTLAGQQNAVTYTIGFGPDVAGSSFLEDVARRGGGRAYAADNVENLTSVLQSIFAEVLQGGNTFTSPSVSVNAFNRTQTTNEIYLSLFQPGENLRWIGNVKKYGIRDGRIVDATGTDAIEAGTGFLRSGARSFWTPGTEPDGNRVEAGGAASRLPTPATRNVYTYLPDVGGATRDLTATVNAFTTSNPALDAARLNTASADVAPADLINWVRGVDVLDQDGDGDRAETARLMGDPLHARPALVAYGGSATNPDAADSVVFVPTNDGMLHAIDARTGVELWSFIPPQLLSRLVDLYRNPVSPTRSYGLDGDVRVLKFDVNQDGVVDAAAGDRVWLFFGMRRGGSHYYALDVTRRTAPSLRWMRGPGELPGIGETWSTPTIARVRVGGSAAQNAENLVLIFGGGYDDAQQNYQYTTDNSGNRVFMIDAQSGNLLWYAGGPGSTGTPDLELDEMTHSIPGRVVALDIDGDAYADRLYAADMGGRIWRFDIWNGRARNDGLVTGGMLATLGGGSTGDASIQNNRRFYYAPDVALIQRRGAEPYYNLAIGSGYRGHPLHTETQDRFYAIRDRNPFTKLTQAQYEEATPLRDGDLVNITPTPSQTTVPSNAPGWKLELTLNGGWNGEKILAEALTVDGTILFTSYQPVSASATDPCRPSNGINRAYALRVDTGLAAIDFNETGITDVADMSTELAQTGIAGSVSLIFENLSASGSTNAQGADPLGRRGLCAIGPEILQRCVVPGSVVRSYWRRIADEGGGD